MKKIVSVFISLVLIFSQAAFAAENNKMAEILQTVKTRLGITDSYDDFQSSSYEDEFSTVYSFSWTNSENSENLEVSCNNKGIITSYYNYIPEYNNQSKPAFSDSLKEKAESTAKDFIKKINPDIFDKVVFAPSEALNSTIKYDFSFEFFLTENGYKVLANNGYISVNSSADRVTSFHMNYIADAEFKNPSSILTKEEAAKKYAEKLGLKLVYKMHKSDKQTKIYPAYIEKVTEEKYIDAVSGEVYAPPSGNFSPLYDKSMNASAGMAVTEEAAMDGASFSEIELKELDNVAGLISKEKAEEIIRQNKIIGISDRLVLNSINLSKDYYEDEKYNYSLVFKASEDATETEVRTLVNLRASVDAKTGSITSFYKYYVNPEEFKENREKISEHTAKEIADNTLSALGTAHKNDFKLSSDTAANPYYYSYTREVNGIEFISNTAHISVEPYTGEVISWSISDYDFEFPSISNVLAAESAAAVLFEQVAYEPVYIVSFDGEKYVSALVYAITDNTSINLNAETGKLINYKGEDITLSNSEVKYTDISEHYAKEKIEKLASYGIALAGKNEFMPDSSILQKEFLAYMLMAFEGEKNISLETDEDIQYIYRRALRLGLIAEDSKAPENAVTRAEAAKTIIRALGFEDVAEINEIYNSPFVDSGDISGYLSIIYGLGIAKGDGSGYFYPDRNITKAETAVMIYNYLSR